MTRRPRSSIVANPILVGAVTVLVTVVGVFLAYNANNGLPFVPVYRVTVEVPRAAGLVHNEEVAIGGKRVGSVHKMTTAVRVGPDGRRRTIAVLELALDKSVGRLPVDTGVTVRPLSPIGLKYVELAPGHAPRTVPDGGRLPLANAHTTVDYDDFLSTYDRPTRDATRKSLVGFGNALARRGADLNDTIGELPSFLGGLNRVMRRLDDPDTHLERLFPAIDSVSVQIAQAGRSAGDLYRFAATTLAALDEHPDELRDTISGSARFLAAANRSFRVERPFLADFARLSRRLQPVGDALVDELPGVNAALRSAGRGLPAATATSRLAVPALHALEAFGRAPLTLPALQSLTNLVAVAEPLVTTVAPGQTVCDYLTYFLAYFGDDVSEETSTGTIQLNLYNSTNTTQDNRVDGGEADRPADIPAGQDPQTATDPSGAALTALHTQWIGPPAVDSAGNADCQTGQTGYPVGPLASHDRYAPSTDPAKGGGSHVVLDADGPGVAGTTYAGRPNLKAVP